MVYSVSVLVTWTLGLTVYHAGSLLSAVSGPGIITQLVIIVLYCYLFYWSLIGFILSIVALV